MRRKRQGVVHMGVEKGKKTETEHAVVKENEECATEEEEEWSKVNCLFRSK